MKFKFLKKCNKHFLFVSKTFANAPSSKFVIKLKFECDIIISNKIQACNFVSYKLRRQEKETYCSFCSALLEAAP